MRVLTPPTPLSTPPGVRARGTLLDPRLSDEHAPPPTPAPVEGQNEPPFGFSGTNRKSVPVTLLLKLRVKTHRFCAARRSVRMPPRSSKLHMLELSVMSLKGLLAPSLAGRHAEFIIPTLSELLLQFNSCSLG